jgi:putative tryptophan/tyrosine transport system substrate-binding protein
MRRVGRRQFLIATGALFTASLAAEAQQAGKVYRIGFLSFASGPLSPHAAFFDGLRDIGYIEGRNLIVERRYAGGNVDRLNEFAADLVRLKVDLIVASATPAAQAAQKATSTIPIIFVAVVDPIGAGLVASLARPDRNITGLSMLSAELSGKRLELLKEIVPKLAQVAVLQNPANASNPLQVAQTEAAARKLGVQLQLLEVRAPDDFETAFQTAVQGRAGALIVLDDPLGFTERTRIAALSTKHRLPVISGFRESAEAGGLVAYGVSLPDHFWRVATYVERTLKGAKPADLPVELPTKFELVINLKTAKTLGIQIPQFILRRADKLIE